MSGGHFDGNQYIIGQIVDKIKDIIYKNNIIDCDDWGNIIGHVYSGDTITELEKAVKLLEVAQIYATRIDWLVSCDDSEETFHKRLTEDLAQIDIHLDIELD